MCVVSSALYCFRLTVLAIKHAYLYPKDGPIFPLPGDIRRGLDDSDQYVNSRLLYRVVSLCNLVTAVYAIVRPDDAAYLYPTEYEDGTWHDRIARRNAILLETWEIFWTTIIPQDLRHTSRAQRLWLDFATQVSQSCDTSARLLMLQITITYRNPTIDPPTIPNHELPLPSRELAFELFQPDAFSEHCHHAKKDSDAESDASVGSMEQEIATKYWVYHAEKQEQEVRPL